MKPDETRQVPYEKWASVVLGRFRTSVELIDNSNEL